MFQGVDPWYHMRLAENMIHNFPTALSWEMFANFPSGHEVGTMPLMSWMIVSLGYLFSFGQPSEHMIGTIGAILPPLFGAGTVVLVYFIGREIASKKVGILAAALVAILPTELMHRTMLGFTDHHAMETFFASGVLLCLIAAMKRKNLWLPILAGISLGFYLQTWWGGLFMVFIIGLWFIIDLFIRLARKEDISRLCFVTSITGIIAFIVYIPSLGYSTSIATYLAGILLLIVAPLAMWLLSKYFAWQVILGATVAGIGGAIVTISMSGETAFHVRSLFESVFWGWGSTISEAMPTDPAVAMGTYGLASILFLGGLYYFIKHRGDRLFLVFTLVMFFATIGQRKWGYYFTVPVALMASYFAFQMSGWVKKELKYVPVGLAVALMFIPSVAGTVRMTTADLTLSQGWQDAMMWMRDNTPEPFLSEDAYYNVEVHEAPIYGVRCWWDYGNWVIYLAHRAPEATPSYQYVGLISQFYVAQSEEEAAQYLQEGIRYIIVDRELLEDKWYAVVDHAEGNTDNSEQIRRDSMALKLWENRAEGYRLVFWNNEVRILEVEQ